MKILQTKWNQIFLTGILTIISCFVTAHADPNVACSLSTSNGILDSILSDYYNGTHQWQVTLAPIALSMYWFWFTCEFMWQLIMKKALGNDTSKLYYWVIVRIFSAQLFAYIFVNPSFYAGIIEYFTNIGAQAGDFTVNINSSNPFATFSPSGIMNTGTCLFDNMQTFMYNNLTQHPIDTAVFAMPMLGCVLFVYVLSALMALALMMTALEAYIVMNGGIILCGFAGASWTQGFWQKYLSYVGGIAIRLFVMCLILGLMKNNLTIQFTQIMQIGLVTGASAYATAWGILIKIFISIFIYAFLIFKIPAMAGSMLTGTVNSGLGDVITGASMLMSGASLAVATGGRLGGNRSDSGISDFAKQILEGSGRPPSDTGSGSSLAGNATREAMQTPTQAAKCAQAQNGKAEAMSSKKNNSEPEKPTFAQYVAEKMAAKNNQSKGSSSTRTELSDSSTGNGLQSPSQSSTMSNNNEKNTDNNSLSNKPINESSRVSSPSFIHDNSSGSQEQSLGANKSEMVNNSIDSGTNLTSNSSTASNSTDSNAWKKHAGNISHKARDLAGSGHAGSAEVNINLHKD